MTQGGNNRRPPVSPTAATQVAATIEQQDPVAQMQDATRWLFPQYRPDPTCQPLDRARCSRLGRGRPPIHPACVQLDSQAMGGRMCQRLGQLCRWQGVECMGHYLHCRRCAAAVH